MVGFEPWSEFYERGSAVAEEAHFRFLAGKLATVLAEAREAKGIGGFDRIMFTKTILGVTNARLLVDHVLPADLAVAHFRPGAILPVTVRFANASSTAQMDFAPDLRGTAIRLRLPDEKFHDLLLTNYPASFARNGSQLMAFVIASAGGRETLLARLAAELGRMEALRIAKRLKASLRLCSSLALEDFWCWGAFLWGARPVRFSLRPAEYTQAVAQVEGGADALRIDLAARLISGDIRFRLGVQRYLDERRTPIENASVSWKQSSSRSSEIATIVIPSQDVLDPPGKDAHHLVDRLAFSPWNAPPQFRPLGSLNRLFRVLDQQFRGEHKAP